ncbi:MAG: response regulator [Solirubrobacteraceae bacterium]
MGVARIPQGALTEALDALGDGVLIVDAEGVIRYANRRLAELFGYSHDELVGAVVERLVPGALRGRHVGLRDGYTRAAWRRGLGHLPPQPGLRSDGSEVAVEISLAPLKGSPALFVAVLRDATDRLVLEDQRLRDAQARAVQEIVGALDAIVWESETPDRRTLKLLGGRDEVRLGYPTPRWQEPGFWASIVHHTDRVAVVQSLLAPHSESLELTYRIVDADGEMRDVRDVVSVTRGSAGEIVRLRGVITDVSGRHELASRLNRAAKMQAVGQLAGGIAHDFNNLLTIVSGYARRLAARPDLASVHEDLEQILTASDRAGQLTRQLLAFSRRGHGPAAKVDVGALVGELAPMLRRLLAADIAFEFRIEPGLAPVVIERTGLEQVIMNLVLNAADAMAAGGTLTIDGRECVVSGQEALDRGVAEGSFLELSIADTGTGIVPETVDRIFEPFFSTKGEHGTGMGLATVHGIVVEAGGFIGVDSSVGPGTVGVGGASGTTFTVALPAVAIRTAATDPEDAGATLLLVEDEPALRTLMVTMLRERGYSVLQAGDGDRALAVAAAHEGQIDLLVTDVVMPRLSGPELVAQLRSAQPGLAVLFMSGYNDSRLVSRGLDEASVNLLVKPFTPAQLVAHVSEALAAADSGGPQSDD